MARVKCQRCGNDMYVKPSHQALGFGKYCSRTCQFAAARKGEIIACDICGTKKYHQRKDIGNNKSGKFFCGKSCQTKWRNSVFIGEKHANWKHGEFVYQSVLRRSKRKRECQVCKTSDVRVLAVHHIDRNRLNNTEENLAWLCHNCHFLVHRHGVGKDQGL